MTESALPDIVCWVVSAGLLNAIAWYSGQARAHEHADPPSGQTVGVDIGIEYRLVRDFERQALLRVELCRFPGRDAKIQRVETIDAVQPTGARGNSPVRLPGYAEKIFLLQPMLGDLAYGGIPGLHAGPQVLRAADVAPRSGSRFRSPRSWQ